MFIYLFIFISPRYLWGLTRSCGKISWQSAERDLWAPQLHAMKLCALCFIMQVPKFGSFPQTNLGAKTCKNCVDFIQLQTCSQISPEQVKISEIKKTWSTAILPDMAKSPVNKKVGHVSLEPHKWSFLGDYISTLRECCPSNFNTC